MQPKASRLLFFMQEEVWVTLKDFPKYAVSSLGRVKNIHTGKIHKPFTDRLQEYPRVMFRVDKDHRVKKMVHVLVAEAFLGKKPKGYEIDHINTDKWDNRLVNLRYVTPEENRNNPKTLENIKKSAQIRKTKWTKYRVQKELFDLHYSNNKGGPAIGVSLSPYIQQ